jgi:tight adherence protein C
MVLVAILAVLLVAVAITFALVAVAEPRVRRTEKLGLIDTYGYTVSNDSELDVAPAHRTFDAIAGTIGDFLAEHFGTLREDELRRRLVAAGYYRIGARRFIGYRVLLTVAVALVIFWLLVLGGSSGGAIFVLTLAAAGIAWIIPSVWLGHKMRTRLEDIDYDMPELIDLLVVILEAGVAFTGAMRIAAERIGGPLGDELRLTIQEQNLGLSTLDALQNWMARCDTPAVATFVRAMVQGERLGISIGQILRNLALEMRKRRRAAAEERAHKAAIKILFPLALLIFPAIFVIVLGPALYRIADTFSGH